jgi:flagellar hook-associated protein 1 FlgK
MSLINGLEIGGRSLNAYKSAITITGHNIANVETPNYTRQRPELEPALSETGILSGVDLDAVTRERDKFADLRYRDQLARFGRWDAQTGYLEQVEGIVGELGEGSLTDLMSRFWNGWHDLADSPESDATRVSLVQAGIALTEKLNEIGSSLGAVQSNINGMIEEKISRVNLLLDEVADLNVRITSLIRNDGNPSDLQDRRETVLDELSKLVGISYSESEDMTVTVRIGGMTLVELGEKTGLLFQETSTGYSITLQDNTPVQISSGEIGGLVELRDDKVGEILERINGMAESLIQAVNDLHSSGYGLDGSNGISFFLGSDATDITVNSDLIESPEKVAAAGEPDSPGDNSIAIAIAGLRDQFSEQHASIVTLVGTQTAQAKRQTENNEILLEQVNAYRQGKFGVSLDEELTNLIRFQRAYQAAAKFVATLDELLQTVVNIK